VTSQPNRIGAGGRIDRSATFTIRFNDRDIAAHPGDTLASALLANGVKIVGRSFKYHRPRGIVSAGVEEANALVQLREGARTEPNSRATTIEAYPGLIARSQGGWPSVDTDIGAVVGAFARFMPAGFYYKTFIGPFHNTRWWMFCERFIRRAAGSGVAPAAPDPDTYERVNAFCDVLVVGAGPAGLAAALAAARAGARVIVAEQDRDLGGALLSEPAARAGDTWLRATVDELERLPNVRLLTRTTTFGAFDGDVYGLVERAWDHVEAPPAHQPRQRYWVVRARSAVMATGAIERPMVFGGNDRPGVMLASAVRSYLNRYGVLCGRTIALFTANDSVYATACELAQAGASVTVVDLRRDLPEALRSRAAAARVEVLAGHAVVATQGGKALTGVDVAAVKGRDGGTQGTTRRVACDLLGVSGGFTPTLHLWSQRGRKPRFDETKLAFLPDDSIPTLVCAGACAGIDAIGDAVASGFAAGQKAAAIAGRSADVGALAPPALADDGWYRDGLLISAVRAADGEIPPKSFVDVQHDVKSTDIELAYREGYVSVEHLKRYTTNGMATDQGKTSNINALARMAELQGASIPAVGTTTFRPPYTPIAFGAIVGREQGRHFRPTRYSPIHAWHAARGAVFIDAGAWSRPRYYPVSAGEDVQAAYVREARHVRAAVGLVDVSPLGKISVQGPDAATFLDRVYTNMFSTLKVGRLRYGVMLRDDGFVLDDGTTARLSETEFFMSTTTVNAGKILARLELLLQTAWTDLEVQVTSVSDQWATIAVSGPKSRQVLQAACAGADLSAQALPIMAFACATIGGVPVRIHRMSYSGELAFEVYIPARFGHAAWAELMRVGDPFGVAPYGTEAMGALRIEKGHVAGGELDGRTTLKDLALERFASAKKQFAGSVLRKRPVLEDPARPSLVGLSVIDKTTPIKAGSLLFSATGEVAGHGEGYVASTTFSPTLGGYVALALLARGQARIGETIRCVDLLAGTTVNCLVTAPCFVDPEGVRQNA
jgi:methylglutamate dehydrogenase subunit C